MNKLSSAILAFFLSTAATGQTSIPLEVDNHPEKEPAPLIVLNVNINIGNGHVSSVFHSTPYMKKTKVQTMNLHILRLERHGDIFRSLIENEDGTNEWQKIQIDGLRYLANDDPAWHYQEFDVYSDGVVAGKERVLSVHRINFPSVLNATDGTALP